MEYIEFVASPEIDQHIILKPEPRPIHRVGTVSVPEGGSALLFILAALTALGWAAIKRYRVRIGGNAVSTRTAR